MTSQAKPYLFISKCLGIDPCRYNGDIITDPFVQQLKSFVHVITACPEVEIGLPTPRDSLRIVACKEGGHRLVQPSTNGDYTVSMNEYAQSYLQALDHVDGFILKSRSPSCGFKDAKIYSSSPHAPVLEKGAGLFGRHVVQQFGHLAIEDEGRLKNYVIREHFLIRLFTLARFREVKRQLELGALLDFHSRNKYLFMSIQPQGQKELGRIAANPLNKETSHLLQEYESRLYQLLSSPLSRGKNVNVMLHIMGYFSNQLTPDEKTFFLSLLEKYRKGNQPHSCLIGVLQSWVVRFQEDYLMNQTFFQPYPEQLMELTDSGKGRDY